MEKPAWEKPPPLPLPASWRRNAVFAWDLRYHTRSATLLRQLGVRCAIAFLLGLLSRPVAQVVSWSPNPEFQSMLSNGTWLGGLVYTLLYGILLEAGIRASMAWKTGRDDGMFEGLLLSPLGSREILAGRLSAALLVTAILHIPSLVAAGLMFAAIPAPQQLPIALALLTLPVGLSAFVVGMAEPPSLGPDDRRGLYHVAMLLQLLMFIGLMVSTYQLLMRSPSLPIPTLAGLAFLLMAIGILASFFTGGAGPT